MDLYTAAESGNVEVVSRLLLNQGPNVDAIAPGRFMTPVQVATLNGHIDVMRLLKEKGANMDVKTGEGITLLHLAAQRPDISCSKFLLDQGANPNSASDDGTRPLHTAVIHGRLENIRLLLSRGAEVNAARNDGNTGLIIAAEHNRILEAELLLDNQAKVNIRNNDGSAALHIAATRKHEVLAQTLIQQYNAEVELLDNSGMLPLHLAARSGSLKIVKYILSTPREPVFRVDPNGACEGLTAMHYAMFDGHLPIIKLLLQYGGYYNAPSYNLEHYYDTVTMAKEMNHLAIMEQYVLIEKMLMAAKDNEAVSVMNYIEMGACINARDLKDGRSVLHHAVQNGNYHLVRALLTKGARPDHQSHEGYTALHLSLVCEEFYITPMLIKHASQHMSALDTYRFYNLKTRWEEETALHMCAKIPRPDMTRLLMLSGAAFNPTNSRNRTPAESIDDEKSEIKKFLNDIRDMFNNIIDGHYQQVREFILRQPTAINARHATLGDTPLYCALDRHRLDIAKFLLAKGANVRLQCRSGTTALHKAAATGCAIVIDDMIAQCPEYDKRPFVNCKTMAGKNSAILNAKTLEVARKLLKHGAYYNDKNARGHTARADAQTPEIAALLDMIDRFYNRVRYGALTEIERASIGPDDWPAIEGCSRYFTCNEAYILASDPTRSLHRSDIESVLDWVMRDHPNAARFEFASVVEGGHDFPHRLRLIGVEL